MGTEGDREEGTVWGPVCGERRGQHTEIIVSGRGGDWHAVKDLMKVRSTWQSECRGHSKLLTCICPKPMGITQQNPLCDL